MAAFDLAQPMRLLTILELDPGGDAEPRLPQKQTESCKERKLPGE